MGRRIKVEGPGRRSQQREKRKKNGVRKKEQHQESEQEAGVHRSLERLKKRSLEHWRQRDKGLDKDTRDLET